jgi:hypothetical protein
LAAVHCWISLESLALDAEIWHQQKQQWQPTSPGNFLPHYAGAAVALTSVKHLIAGLWQVLRDFARAGEEAARWIELEQWLGVRANMIHVDLDRWLELIATSDTTEDDPAQLDVEDGVELAAARLREIASSCGPFCERRLALARELLGDGARLSDWASATSEWAKIAATRSKHTRHRAVHRAQYEDRFARQTRQAILDVADAVFEVAPKWFGGAGSNASKPWEALRDAGSHFETLRTQWQQAGQGVSVDPGRLTSP